jgi:MoaA/NifB/PqqE/SkfB family radical SAM enzyme
MVMLDKPFVLQWHLTERCNLRCKHCYQNLAYLNQEVSLERKKDSITSFVRFCKKIKRTPRIAFTGGEPLILGEELFKLLEFSKEKYPELEACVLSNGTLLTDQTCKRLKDLGVLYVQISLDGFEEKTHDFVRGPGNYQKAISAIKKLAEYKIRTAVMFVFHKKNYLEVPKLIELCNSLGVSALGITELVPEGQGTILSELLLTPEEVHNLYLTIYKKQKEIEQNGGKLKIDMKRPLWALIEKELQNQNMTVKDVGGACAAGFSGLALMPNEDIMPCRRMDIVIGNLKKESFFDIWYSSELLNTLRERKTGECANCELNYKCSSCKAVSRAVCGSFFAKDPLCWKNACKT